MQIYVKKAFVDSPNGYKHVSYNVQTVAQNVKSKDSKGDPLVINKSISPEELTDLAARSDISGRPLADIRAGALTNWGARPNSAIPNLSPCYYVLFPLFPRIFSPAICYKATYPSLAQPSPLPYSWHNVRILNEYGKGMPTP